jgi:putative nucleotidyltransferase with HDIG domain
VEFQSPVVSFQPIFGPLKAEHPAMNGKEEYLILIVDDDHTLCNALSKFFSDSGFKTVLAFNGQQAIELFNELHPHVVILDIHMPVMDGIQFLNKTRQDGTSPPVIVTTAHPDINTAIEAIQNGAFDYIVKPFELDVLQQKVNRALQTTKLVRENMLLSQLVSLHEITHKLTSTHDIEELLDVTFQYCLSVSKADTGSIQLVHKNTGELVIVRKKGIQLTELSSPLSNPEQWPISKWVVKNGRSLLISDTDKLVDIHVELHRDDVESSLCVPLKVGEEVIGVINLNRGRNKEQFSQVDLNIVNMLATQASIAVNNANLLSSIRQKLDELSLISNYSEQLMGFVDESDVIRCLFTTAQKHFAIDVIAFLIVEKRNYELLYWSRGALSQQDITNICSSVIVEYNRATHGRVQQKRVTYRQLMPPAEFAPDILPPLAFTYVVPVVGEAFDYGALYFGAMKDIENKQEKLTLLSSIVSQTRIALTNSKLYNDMKENYIRTIKALAIAVDAKDTYTHGHSENVMNIAEEIAREMGVDSKKCSSIRDAGLLHDIGKIGIPGYILNKHGSLTYEEFNGIMKTHSAMGANIVKDVPFLSDLYKLILYHHENYDGTGYPEGLKADAIPVGARVIRVADAFEAMTSNRPYRTSLGKKEAVKRLEEGKAKMFDPVIVDAFMRVAKRKKWLEGEELS